MERAGLPEITRRCILRGFIAWPTAAMASAQTVRALVDAMEARYGLRVTTLNGLNRTIRAKVETQDARIRGAPAVSPEGRAIGWWERPFQIRNQGMTFFVRGEDTGTRSFQFEAYSTGGPMALSSHANTIIVVAYSSRKRAHELLAVDASTGAVRRNLTSSTMIDLARVERLSITEDGATVAIGLSDKIEVLSTSDGKMLFSGLGRFPKLSPEGKHLAFVGQEVLYLRSFENNATTRLLPNSRVMGTGSWSPDGRFLLAGAWTMAIALEKRRVVIDTQTSEYAVIGKLGDGDYGDQLLWVSTKLMGGNELKQRK
jgi:hypothetical protein